MKEAGILQAPASQAALMRGSGKYDVFDMSDHMDGHDDLAHRKNKTGTSSRPEMQALRLLGWERSRWTWWLKGKEGVETITPRAVLAV